MNEQGGINTSGTASYVYMACPLITELEVRRAVDGLHAHKGAGPDGLFPKTHKALNSHIAPLLAFHSKLPSSLKMGAEQ